ncbi:glycosyltransferase family 2 protein [Cereibacter changlensis]|uniref:glycosyltransferase family 2 protein n=1 Tax=Cereibacter changlensis TaxID=402884 RepID=UPI00200ACDD9|nr:glycosyltransferase family 2 protein [Cereibacter changlensis]
MDLIISLSSIPSRFAHLGPTLNSLLTQRRPPDEVRIYVPHAYRRFPEWNGSLPEVPAGVTVLRADCDYGPATKILPAVRDLQGTNTEILFCDDDRIYDPLWTSRFLVQRSQRPDCALVEAGGLLGKSGHCVDAALRVRKGIMYRAIRAASLGLIKPRPWARSGFVDIAKGYGGVMIRPDFLPSEAFDIPEILWTVDDYWLSGCLRMQGIDIWLNAEAPVSRESRAAACAPLLNFTTGGHDRGKSNAACVAWFRDKYGVWVHPTM